MKIAVPKERSEGERRVPLVPDSVEKLVADERQVVVEAGAGGDFYPYEAYAKAGAEIVEEDATAVLDVGAARRVVFVKRSLAPGFAGIDNPLFYDEEKTMMLFSDAREGLEEMLDAVENG